MEYFNALRSTSSAKVKIFIEETTVALNFALVESFKTIMMIIIIFVARVDTIQYVAVIVMTDCFANSDYVIQSIN